VTKAEFIAQALPILERLVESTQGIADFMGEETPEDAADDIAALLPPYVWTD
jgi:hypothetical protein